MDHPSPGDDAHDDDDDRHLEFNGRTVLTLCGFLAAAILGLYLLLPQLAGLEDTWSRIEDGSPGWIVLAFALTFGMFGGYVEMFRGVFGHVDRIGRRESYLITMAGLAASRIFAAGGAGGLVLQAWALRQAGLAKRMVADKTIAFLVLTYFPYAAAVVICGVGLRLGHLPRRGAVHDDGDPGDHRRDPDGADEPDPARPDRPAAPARRLRAAHGPDRADHQAAGHDPRRHVRRPARGAQPHPLAQPRAARRDRLLGLPDRRPVGRLPGLRRRAARRRARSRPSSSACSATCCRSPVASAASKVA